MHHDLFRYVQIVGIILLQKSSMWVRCKFAFNLDFAFGAGDASYLEPLFSELLVHFNKLMETYEKPIE